MASCGYKMASNLMSSYFI